METLKIGTRTFALLPACTFGDYGGDGSVGLANIRELRKQFSDRMVEDSFSSWHSDGTPETVYVNREWVDRDPAEFDGVSLIVLTGGYSSESAYLDVDCAEYQDIAASLEDYPVLDDDLVCEIESDWEDAAIIECCHDVGRKLSSDYLTEDDEDRATLEDVWQELDAEKQAEIVRQAMQDGNIYASVEYSSSFISASDVAPYVRAILQKGATLVRAYKLPDGTMVEVDTIESETEYQSPVIPTGTTSTANYVRKFCELNHLRG